MSRTSETGRRDALDGDSSTFVGRRREMAEATRLLAGSRLLTLAGPGGIGKTRLALRLSASLGSGYDDGVVFVELDALQDPDLLPHTIAAAAGFRDAAATWSDTAVAERLAGQRSLLILDNCEHLIDACASFVRELLSRADQVKVVATSREPLRIRGENVLLVPPLAIPAPDCAAPSEADLSLYDSAQLFLDRASAKVPDLDLDAEGRACVAAICSRLDGMPLAIELAAERMRVLSPRQILSRLESGLGLLAGGERGGPSRQQTLHASINWSYDLCPEEERRVWERLSVFPGGFEIEAAEAVCGDAIEVESCIDQVTALLDKSILTRTAQAGLVRYRMLEPIRAFGLAKLGSRGEVDLAKDLHLRWVVGLVHCSWHEWLGPAQAKWLRRLQTEHANIRSALRFALDRGATAHALRLASDLEFYYVARGLIPEGRVWLDECIAQQAADSPDHDRVRALQVNAYLAVLQGSWERADEMLQEAGSIADAEHPREAVVRGLASMLQGRYADAVGLLDNAVGLFRAADDRPGEIYALLFGAMAHALSGATPEAFEAFETCLAVTAEIDESFFRGYALTWLALLEWRDGEGTRAEQRLAESLEAKMDLDDQLGLALTFDILAWIAAASSESRRAACLLGVANSVWQRAGTTLDVFSDLTSYRDECEASILAEMTPAAYGSALRKGQSLPLDEALALSLRRPPSRATNNPTGASPLTSREFEVAQLAAQGLTNRQIASRLTISPRTAEGHMENILTKLGFSTRSQVAAWFTERRTRLEP